MTILLFLLGLVLLIAGAEALVRGSSRLAAVLGISPLVIGLTVVAFGTGAPELAVSIKSVLSEQAGLAVGNVIGSNIVNVLLILGLSAAIAPLVVSQQLVRLDVPLMVAISILVFFLCLDAVISRVDGLVLLAGFAAYIAFVVYQSRKERSEVKEQYDKEFGPAIREKSHWVLNVGLIVLGLVLLVLGSRWLVDSAVTFARYLGVSDVIVGLTIVAAGTSLPEIVTSAIAAVRGERDIAVGNVIGSNIFNIMAVLGVAGLIAPTGIEVSPAVIRFDLPVMIAVAFACLPVFFTGGVISRQEGVFLLGYYIAYTLYLILAASHHDALPEFSAVMLYFVAPLTVITIVIMVLREVRLRRQKRAG